MKTILLIALCFVLMAVVFYFVIGKDITHSMNESGGTISGDNGDGELNTHQDADDEEYKKK